MSRLRLVLVLDWVILALAVLAVVDRHHRRLRYRVRRDPALGAPDRSCGARGARGVAGAVACRPGHSAAEWPAGLGRAACATGCSTAPPTPNRRSSAVPAGCAISLFATAGLLAIGAVLMHTQLAQMTRGAGPRRSPVLDVAHGVGVPAARRRPPPAVRCQHLPPRAADPDVLRLDAAAGRDRRAAARHRAEPGGRLQPPVPLRVPALRDHHLRPDRGASRVTARGVRRRADLRLLPVPLRALQPSRAPDDLLDAAGTAGAPSPVADVAHAVCDRAGAVRCGGAVLVDVLRRVLPALRRRDPRDADPRLPPGVAPHRARRSPPAG